MHVHVLIHVCMQAYVHMYLHVFTYVFTYAHAFVLCVCLFTTYSCMSAFYDLALQEGMRSYE